MEGFEKKIIFCFLYLCFSQLELEGQSKILFAVNKFPRITETFILSQITGLIDKGYDVSIWAYQKGGSGLLHPSVKKYRLLDRVTYIDYLDSKMHDFMRQKVAGFDIIYCQYDWIGTVFAKIKCKSRFKGKLVVCVRGGSLKNRVKENPQGYKLLFKYTDLFLPVCCYFAQSLIDLGVQKEKIIVHHSAIDCKAISYKQRDYSHGPIRILSVARLRHSKGLEFGIKAIARLCRKYPDICYTIIGGGTLFIELKNLINRLGMNKNIKLLGWQQHKEVVKHLYRSHILLHSSIGSEGIPNVIMEAFASGLPVVSTLVNGIPEIVEDGISGFVVMPRRVKALMAKLEYLIAHPKLCNIMGSNGRAYVEREHNIDIENGKLELIFKI